MSETEKPPPAPPPGKLAQMFRDAGYVEVEPPAGGIVVVPAAPPRNTLSQILIDAGCVDMTPAGGGGIVVVGAEKPPDEPQPPPLLKPKH